MKNKEKWRPSKFVYRDGALLGSRDTREVGAASRLMADAVARAYDQHLRTYAAGRLLDLGCGQVPFFQAYKELVSDNVCVDWSSSLHKNEFVDHECDLTQPLPFESGAFNTIILSDVLEHIAEPEKLWHEMARVLALEGNLILNVPFFYWLHERPHDYYRYTEHAIRRFAAGCGLSVVHLSAIGGAPEIVADIVSKNAMRVPRIGHGLAKAVQWTVGTFVNTKLGRKVSVETSADFPFGYFCVARKSLNPT